MKAHGMKVRHFMDNMNTFSKFMAIVFTFVVAVSARLGGGRTPLFQSHLCICGDHPDV